MPSPLTIQPDETAGKDTVLYEIELGGHGTQTTFDSGNTTGSADRRRSLIAFDVSPVPATATVTSAIASIYEKGAGGGEGARTIGLYRCLLNWVEAQADWEHYATGSHWGTAGCAMDDVDAASAASATVVQDQIVDNAFVAWGSSAGLIADVQAWVSGSASNYGWLLRSSAESPVNGWNTFWSSDYTVDTSLRPKLVVTYTEGFVGMLVTRKVG